MDQANQMTLTFRCLPALESILPRPFPAVQGLPDWFKAMPHNSFNPTCWRGHPYGEEMPAVSSMP